MTAWVTKDALVLAKTRIHPAKRPGSIIGNRTVTRMRQAGTRNLRGLGIGDRDARQDGDQRQDDQRQVDLTHGHDEAKFGGHQRERTLGKSKRHECLADRSLPPEDDDPGKGAHHIAGQHRDQRQENDDLAGGLAAMPVEKRDRHAEQGRADDGLQAKLGGVNQDTVVERIAEKARIVVQ